MEHTIKTRQTVKDIKSVDKIVNHTERIRYGYERTKEKAEQTQEKGQDNYVDYAENKVTRFSENVVRDTAHKIEVRSPFSPLRGEKDYQPKEEQSKPLPAEQSPKTFSGSIEQRNPPSSPQVAEPKSTVKTAEKTVKTAKQTEKVTIKTTEQATVKAYQTEKASIKATEKATVAAKKTAKTAEKTTKSAAESAAKIAKKMKAAAKKLIELLSSGGWVAVLIIIIVVLFGASLYMIGGDNAETVSPVSEEVKAYEPIIRKYAKQYGIEEYVELIKAVMMQESGGKGNDPMQSSEGGFNTKYPREPNGITDPEYSIECGVQEIKDCLERAKVENPLDMTHIKLALQGYNYGNGYIEWAVKTYGGYTMANAAEFSDMKAKELGWTDYGDKQYVPHVLRYYSLGRITFGVGNQAIVQVALTQEGNAGDTYWSWYGFESREEWCACFVSWCAEQCGFLESGVIPKFSLCSDGKEWFEKNNQFQDASYVPSPGDIIFFDWGNDGSVDHVGIVENVKKGVVYTVEGNSSDMVKKNSYAVGSNSIYGYGVPAY